MKKILLLSAAVLSIIAVASCAKEETGPESFRTIINASLASTKTALGDKEGASWPNYWKTGDKISVNGVASEALAAEYDGKASASFSFESLVETPYCAVYPASALESYSDGSATVILPAVQEYVAGSYDPSAFIMGGKSTEASSVVLSPCVSIVHISLSGTESISKVKLTGPAGSVLSGTFTTNFSTYTPQQSVSNEVEMVPENPVALPAEFFICVPAGLSGSLKVEAFDNEGGSMTKNATVKSPLAAGQMYSPSTIPYTASYDIAISAECITSSTAVICWDNSPAAAYTIGVYSDAACSALVDSYAVEAGSSCWADKSPRFCISGLAANTTYYVKVTNATRSVDSNILSVKTSEFEIVQVSSTPADEGDVILAEDFSELRWDCDMIGNGAGWFPTSEAQTSFGTVEVGSWQAAATSNEKQLSSQTNALVYSRLMNWAQGAYKNMYIHPGYLKLVGSKNVTHLVTPALNNIPDGLTATLKVEVTASRYYSESNGAFATDKAIVAVQTGNEIGELIADATNKLDLSSNIASFSLKDEVAWNTYTVTVSNVVKGNRLAFGADKSVSGNDARMNISDIKVTVVELLAPGELSLSLKEVSSSTASFTWTHVGSDAAYDISKAYLAAIYSDSDCLNLVASYEIPAESGCWDNKQPSFVFSGLAPSTNYWVKVTDTTEDVDSEVVSCTTSAFTVVDATTVSNAGVGDVILAEDFSEIGWGSEELTTSAGFYPTSKRLYVPSGAYTTDDGAFSKYNGQTGRVYGDTKVESDKRLFNWGFFGNSNVFAYAGYVRVGAATSGTNTHIVSPALSGIPAGKKATIDVTVTSGQYANNANDVAVFVEKASDMSLILAPDQKDNSNFSGRGGKYDGATLSKGYALNAKTRAWTTSTVRIPNVTNDTRLLFGSYENIDTKNRFFLNDVVVRIVELKDPGTVDIEVDIQDFNTFKAFLEACEPGKAVKGNVVADITLTSEQLAEIDALYPVADFDGILNGNDHTITGLTKPLFNDFRGTASNLTLNSTLNITDAQDKVGIFAKSAIDATLTGCVSTGSITHASLTSVDGDLIIGGLIGSISGSTLTACHNLANVTNTTTATEHVRMGGLIGVADGANTLTGTSAEYNYNKSVILENSASTSVAVGGICGYTFGAPSDFAYAQNQIPDGDDVDDIVIQDNTRDKVYVGGIIGMSATTSSFDYASNVDADVVFQDLTMSATGQVFAGGIIGGWSASGDQIITGCSNSGYIYTKKHADSDNYYDDISVGDTPTPLWSCFGGIAGMGSGTSEGLNGGVATISGKTFKNCSMSGRIQIYCKVRCCIGGVIAYTENDPVGCVCTNNIRLYKKGGIGTTGSGSSQNYHRQIVGGVVGYFNGSSATNLKYDGTILTQSSSPYAYTSGIIGYLNTSAIELNNCRIGGSTRAAGTGGGRSAVMCHNNTNKVSVTFTNCLIKKGTISYATGSKVTFNADSDITAAQCMGASDTNYTIVGDVLPTVASSI